MTVYSTFYIGGSLISDAYDWQIEKSIGENNSSSSFTTNISNFDGVHKTDWSIGDEVLIYASKDINPPTTKIFAGILEDKKHTGKEQDETLVLTGRDYTARLMDRTVEPEVYTSLPAGSIVKDIVSKYVDNITTGSYVDDSLTIVDRITFNHTPVFDAVKKLADLADYTFYIDEDKNLHFIEKEGVSSGQTFDNTNILKSDFKELRDTVYNQVWVYGDRYLDGYRETFTAPATGSIYTLLYSPHNTSITVNTTGIQPGGIYEMSYGTGSAVKYLVNFNDKQIIFTSGTDQGNNIPKTGSIVIVSYQRALPVVKVGDNEISKALYGTRVKVINDKDIKDPNTAEQILARELDKSSYPKKEGRLDIRGVVNITPGQTCVVDVPYHNISSQTYDILEARYDFNKENCLSDSVLSIKVNKKIADITDTMKDIILELKKLQTQDISATDIITRLQYTIGSLSIRQSGVEVWTRTIGSSFILSHPINGLLGSYANHHLGDYRLGSTLNFSGGYF